MLIYCRVRARKRFKTEGEPNKYLLHVYGENVADVKATFLDAVIAIEDTF